jgi:DNA polymerase III epsilon subunit family exonuclease
MGRHSTILFRSIHFPTQRHVGYNAAVRRTAALETEPILPRTFVAVDVETTGFKSETDAIIEVGAVKFVDGEAVDEFTTLVDPRRRLPPDITLITGITDKDLIGKPRIENVVAPLMRFVGNHPVVGHNVSFDLGFLRAAGALPTNDAFDTWELASILVPSLPSYSLGSLAAHFDVRSPSQHRAADDARATGRLFALLCERAAHLPPLVLLEINRLAANSDWPARVVFAEALSAAGLNRLARRKSSSNNCVPAARSTHRHDTPNPSNRSRPPSRWTLTLSVASSNRTGALAGSSQTMNIASSKSR